MNRTNKKDETTQWRALLEILRGRRSRRFGLGMKMDSGPMAYEMPLRIPGQSPGCRMLQ